MKQRKIKTYNQAIPPTSAKGKVDAGYSNYKVVAKHAGCTMILATGMTGTNADLLIKTLKSIHKEWQCTFIKIH